MWTKLVFFLSFVLITKNASAVTVLIYFYVTHSLIQAIGVAGENACIYIGTSGFQFATHKTPEVLWNVRWVYFLKQCLALCLLL